MDIGTDSAIIPVRNDLVTMTDRIYDSILRMVTEHPEEHAVLTERYLISRFGSSKAPVREALIRLCNERILKSIPRFGYVVLRLSARDAINIIQFRLINELGAAKEYMHTVTENDLEPLEAYLAKLQKTKLDDVWKIWDENIKYHTMLISLAKNDLLVRNLTGSMRTLRRYYAQYYSQEQYRNQFVFKSGPHCSIFESLKAKDYDRFLERLREDIKDGGRIYKINLG
ncbi:MAG: GntR family transcriptional regulator [Treponema sp.]|jgi:DNA-binding GntR family transcriptional regulator|nr:GntR family transcriptional regulator [Treponema sp.]